MLFLIFACFNNFGVKEILPSLSNCKLILSESIDVAKWSFLVEVVQAVGSWLQLFLVVPQSSCQVYLLRVEEFYEEAFHV